MLTTRHNLAYSHDNAITISGFIYSEFSEYLKSLRERNILSRDLVSAEQKRIYDLTGGSPLFTESVCRLIRFLSFNEAIKGWGKDEGSKARAAALDREVSMLSPEAKRVLLAVSLLTEASVPEISEITEYSHEDIHKYIQELSSLFLLAGETLADQPRFSVPENTVKLVTERSTILVTDHKKITEKVKLVRGTYKSGISNDNRVGLAIAQANTLLRSGDSQSALATIDDARKKLPKNSDLISYKTVLLMQFDPPRFEEARRLAREAYNMGCRRPSMISAWFEAEWCANHYMGAEEAARAAISNSIPGFSEWRVKLAAALVSRADSSKSGVSIDTRVKTFFDASFALMEAIKASKEPEAKDFQSIQFDIHDRIWNLIVNNLGSLDRFDFGVEALEKMVKAGDSRFINANHALTILNQICSFLESPTIRKSQTTIAASEIRIQRCIKMIDRRKAEAKNDVRNAQLDEQIDKFQARYAEATNTQKIELAK